MLFNTIPFRYESHIFIAIQICQSTLHRFWWKHWHFVLAKWVLTSFILVVFTHAHIHIRLHTTSFIQSSSTNHSTPSNSVYTNRSNHLLASCLHLTLLPLPFCFGRKKLFRSLLSTTTASADVNCPQQIWYKYKSLSSFKRIINYERAGHVEV